MSASQCHQLQPEFLEEQATSSLECGHRDKSMRKNHHNLLVAPLLLRQSINLHHLTHHLLVRTRPLRQFIHRHCRFPGCTHHHHIIKYIIIITSSNASSNAVPFGALRDQSNCSGGGLATSSSNKQVDVEQPVSKVSLDHCFGVDMIQ